MAEDVSFESFCCLIEDTYEEILGVNVSMLGLVEVLFGHEHTFLEDVLVDLLAIGFGDEHCRELLAQFGKSRTMLS
jgi:hypothetical protein